MKKIILFFAFAVTLVSCGTTEKLINTATHTGGSAPFFVNPVCADIKVDGKKISFFMPVSENISAGGLQNVIDTAVKDALEQNGNADLLVGLQTQVKYDSNGDIESIAITGYPARYINFRNLPNAQAVPATAPEGEKGGVLAVFKKKK